MARRETKKLWVEDLMQVSAPKYKAEAMCRRVAGFKHVLLSGASACAIVILSTTNALYAQQVSPDAQLLLNADQVEYDFDNDRVAAKGSVQIEYDGYRLVAGEVIYDQSTGRLTATSNVQIVDPDGNVISSDKIDITDDFGDGFVDALRLETIDKTRFAAASATREDGNITTFNKGIYTACLPCQDNPDKAPTWQVKAETIIWNQEKRTIRFKGSKFEFFGKPLIFLPSFEIADHTVKRKSGFLIPSANYDSRLGASVSIPYFMVVSPTSDITFTPRYYTKQGFLGEAEWRQAFENGIATLKVAGMQQQDPDSFDAGTEDADADTRWMVGTTGQFKINPRWSFGWNYLEQSDNNFSKTYSIGGFSGNTRKSTAFLKGLSGKNYFNAEFSRFEAQSDTFTRNNQARVLPGFDYSYTLNNPVLGGELNFDINTRHINRSKLNGDFGINGDNGRVTGEVEWKRTFISPGGLALTPILAARGDAFYTDSEARNASFSNVAADVQSEFYQYMATAGLEARYPILFSTASSTHILEPTAQILVRPDARGSDGVFTLNEDAQSFVFDASNLFDRDKFSGFDRVEGGVRANVGFRYMADYDNGLSVDAVAGQSYHLAGVNPFASADLLNVGAGSGLQEDVSDFVAGATLSYLNRLSLGASFRFDKDDLSLERTELVATASHARGTASVQYTNLSARPDYAFAARREEVAGNVTLKLTENFTVSAGARYDIIEDNLYQHSIALAYDDECFHYGLSYSNTNPLRGDEVHTVGFSIKVRTIGDFGLQQTLDNE